MVDWQWLIPVGALGVAGYVWWDVRRINRAKIAPPPKPRPLLEQQATPPEAEAESLPFDIDWEPPQPPAAAMTPYDWASVHEQIAASAARTSSRVAVALSYVGGVSAGVFVYLQPEGWRTWFSAAILFGGLFFLVRSIERTAQDHHDQAQKRRETLEQAH